MHVVQNTRTTAEQHQSLCWELELGALGALGALLITGWSRLPPSDGVGMTAEKISALRNLGSGAEGPEILYEHRPRLFLPPAVPGRNELRFCTKQAHLCLAHSIWPVGAPALQLLVMLEH